MTELLQPLRHACAKHPDNALAYLRGHASLSGKHVWHLLGIDRIVTYCPWCGGDLETLRELGEATIARAASPKTLVSPEQIERGPIRFIMTDIGPFALRSATLHAPRAVRVPLLLCEPNGPGVQLLSFKLGREEQLMAPGIPCELFAIEAVDAEHPDPFPRFEQGTPVTVSVRNTGASPANITVYVLDMADSA